MPILHKDAETFRAYLTAKNLLNAQQVFLIYTQNGNIYFLALRCRSNASICAN